MSNNIKTIGIDLAKEIFHLHAVNDLGEEVLKRRLSSRKRFMEFMNKLDVDRKSCVVAMESCSGANYFAKKFRELGYECVSVIPAQFVKPYVKTNKNDFADAAAIVKAALDPDMRFCSIKEDWQQDIAIIHRVRSRFVKQRTALGNEIRGFLAEYGVTIPRSINKLKSRLDLILNGYITNQRDVDILNLDYQRSKINDYIRPILNDLLDELKMIDDRIKKVELQLRQIAHDNSYCQKLLEIPGIGLITATALISQIGNASRFKNGRELSAYFGLVPKQNSSGGKNKLLGISKRGNRYLRTLLIHGARAIANSIDRSKNIKNNKFSKNQQLANWFNNLRKRKNANVAVVALANKLARICFVVLSKDVSYNPTYAV